MMTVTQAIASLLYDHAIVTVPALGAFVRIDESAQVNVITNEFERPRSVVGFDSGQREENPLLIDCLKQHNDIDDDEARQLVAAFVADVYGTLRESGTFVIDGIGTLTMNADEELEFAPDPAADFNADAFGLTDLTATSVYHTERETPDTTGVVDPAQPSEAVAPMVDDEPKPRRRWWPWFLLALLVGAAVIWFFRFRAVEPPTPPAPPTPPDITETIDTLAEPVEATMDTLAPPVDTLAPPTDTMAEPDRPVVNEPATPTEVVKPEPESKAFIVGGCFSVEQNAMNMVAEAFEQGCHEAFVMKRGSMFFVCYGQYPSAAEAKAALHAILSDYNSKAWILIK